MTKSWTESTPSEPPAAVCSSSGRGFAPPSRRTNRPHKDRHLPKLLQLAIAIRQKYFIDENWAKKALLWCFQVFDSNAIAEEEIEVKKEIVVVKEDENSGVYEQEEISTDSKNLAFDNNRAVITFDDVSPLYKETIRKETEAQGKYKELIKDNYEYGVVKIRFEPITGNEFIFENAINDGSIPTQYIPVIEKGIIESARNGFVSGFPIIGVKATLLGGLYHPITSTDNAFIEAAKKAFEDGISRAYPIVLEAIGILKVDIPSEKLKDIFNDINARRGRVLGTESSENKNYIIVKAEVPLPEMGEYSAFLTQIAGTKAQFRVEFIKYDHVSKDLVKRL